MRDKSVKFRDADYIIDDVTKLDDLMPYLYHKLDGMWRIILVEPPLEKVRLLLEEEAVPKHIELIIYIEEKQYETLAMERPNLKVKKLSNWEKYLLIIADTDRLFEPKAISELYKRVAGNIETVKDILPILCNKVSSKYITVKDVKLYVQDNRTIYASEIVELFIMGNRFKWEKFHEFEKLLGTDYAFYSIRKRLRLLLKEKARYLNNEDVDAKLHLDKLSAMDIARMYSLFECATSYNQLYILLLKYERGELC